MQVVKIFSSIFCVCWICVTVLKLWVKNINFRIKSNLKVLN